MIAFWLAGALLAALAVALVLRPMVRRTPTRRDANVAIYRDQVRELDADLAAGKLAPADHARARTELEARLLEDVAAAPEAPQPRFSPRAAWAVGAALPVFGLALYLAIGNPQAITRPDEHALTVSQLETMVERLNAKLRENPDDADGWRLLGRSYMVLGRFPESADAYAKAAVRAPRDAQLLADFADALAMARGQAGAPSLLGEPEKLVLRALELEPTNLKALALAGTAAFERKEFAAAAAYWERMLPHVAPDSEDARAIRSNIAEARAHVEKPGTANALRGTVALAPSLKGKAKPEDTVFIFARAADGPPLPLAVLKKQVRDLPLSFSFDDSMAMAPGMMLSSQPRVVVTARVSKSGKPTPQPGDLQGASAAVANDASGVAVVIDSVVR
jgi:cytochrome c-type biogenesis protein CcmH